MSLAAQTWDSRSFPHQEFVVQEVPVWKTILRALVPTPLRQAIQRRRLDRVLANYPVRQVRHKYGDSELVVELTDPLGEGWYDHDWPTLPEIAILRSGGLRTGGVVFDLGAHHGVVALMLAREVGSTGKVIAVEALPHNAETARRNRQLNEMSWIEVVNAGVTGVEGVLRLSHNLNATTPEASDHGGTFEIAAVTVDSLREQYGQPHVLFIDVEGMELEALRGATRTLEARPDVFVEIHTGCGLEARGGTVAEVIAFFPAEHYNCYVHTESVQIPVCLTDAPSAWLRERFFLTAVRTRR
ncbi:MAG: hypothetical protein C0467_13725 [Planctomycetaceae bacterium]|nr:hypothetical protein [Planctomycetaceae bacterium]